MLLTGKTYKISFSRLFTM